MIYLKPSLLTLPSESMQASGRDSPDIRQAASHGLIDRGVRVNDFPGLGIIDWVPQEVHKVQRLLQLRCNLRREMLPATITKTPSINDKGPSYSAHASHLMPE